MEKKKNKKFLSEILKSEKHWIKAGIFTFILFILILVFDLVLMVNILSLYLDLTIVCVLFLIVTLVFLPNLFYISLCKIYYPEIEEKMTNKELKIIVFKKILIELVLSSALSFVLIKIFRELDL